MDFSRATLRIASDPERGTSMKIKRHGENLFTDCFNLEQTTLPGNIFTVFASFSGAGKSNHHYLHSIKFYDLEDVIKSSDETKHEPMQEGSADILHQGNKDASLATDRNASIIAYNR